MKMGLLYTEQSHINRENEAIGNEQKSQVQQLHTNCEHIFQQTWERTLPTSGAVWRGET